MHGVRLVRTPAPNRSGSATRGRPESVLARLEKSMWGGKLLKDRRIRNEPPGLATCSQFRRPVTTLHTHVRAGTGRSHSRVCPILAGSGRDVSRPTIRTTLELSMRCTRFACLALAALPLIAACDDDNDLGLGVGGGDRYTATLT